MLGGTYKQKYYSTEELDQLTRDSAVQKFKEDKVIFSIKNAKCYKRSFKNRLKKAEEIFLDLNGKNEVEGLTEEEFDLKDSIEEEIEELRQAIEKIEKFK